MVDQTGHEIRVGDLEGIDAVGSDRAEPRLTADASPLDITRAQRPVMPPPARPVRDRRDLVVYGLGAACVLLLVLVGVLFWQQQRMTASIAALEARSAQSVQYLENRVASTNSTLRSADAETQKSFNVIAADIGRLNDGLNRTGRQLEQHGAAIAATGADLKALSAELKRVAQANEQADADAAARLKALADSLDQYAARQKTQGDAIVQLQKSGELAQLRGDVAMLNGSLKDLEDAHDRRLKSLEQAVASTDAFRRQVNTTIDRLTQQVNELYQRR